MTFVILLSSSVLQQSDNIFFYVIHDSIFLFLTALMIFFNILCAYIIVCEEQYEQSTSFI